jgi:hypothetical protein
MTPKKRAVSTADNLTDTPEYLRDWAKALVKAGKADARIALEQYQSIASDKRVSKADREIAANRAKAILQFI